jgi:Zn-dependent protease with chaperone function
MVIMVEGQMDVINIREDPEVIRRAKAARRKRLNRWLVDVYPYLLIWGIVVLNVLLNKIYRYPSDPRLVHTHIDFPVVTVIAIIFAVTLVITTFLLFNNPLFHLIMKRDKVLDNYPSSPRLKNALENVGLATGQKPLTYRMMQSSMPNAVGAVVWSKPYIVVTSGLLEIGLNESELTAIVAHEIARIAISKAISWRRIYLLTCMHVALPVLTIGLAPDIIYWLHKVFDNPLIIPPLKIWYVISAALFVFCPLWAIWRLSIETSQEDDLYADALAVTICHDPHALASAIHKVAEWYGGTDNWSRAWPRNLSGFSRRISRSFFVKPFDNYPLNVAEHGDPIDQRLEALKSIEEGHTIPADSWV